MPVQAPPSPTGQKPKVQTPKQHAQQIARQVLSEPFEILKNAGQQISGGQSEGVPHEQGLALSQDVQERQIAEQNRKVSHMQAFQQELHEIEVLQRQREKERDELRKQEEQEKLQKEKQKEQAQSSSPLEIIGKVKRGMFGGGQKANIHKKQRSAELVKTPSN